MALIARAASFIHLLPGCCCTRHAASAMLNWPQIKRDCASSAKRCPAYSCTAIELFESVMVRTAQIGNLEEHTKNVMAEIQRTTDVELKEGDDICLIFALKRVRVDDSLVDKLRQSCGVVLDMSRRYTELTHQGMERTSWCSCSTEGSSKWTGLGMTFTNQTH